jgi:hypothetical protein
VELTCQAVQAEQSANLCPVTNFVQQDVDNNLARCGPQKIVQQIEILWDIPVLAWKRLYEFLQICAALLPKLKEPSTLELGSEAV